MSPGAAFAFDGYRIKVWTTENGLPRSGIECIEQTPDGYLWVATRDGLVQFDGVKFTRADEEVSRESRPIFAKRTAVDAHGALWVASKRGLLRRDAGGWTTFTVSDGLCGAETSGVWPSRDGEVWASTSGGLSRWRNGRLECFRSPSQDWPFLYAVLKDSSGTVWTSSIQGLHRFDPGSGAYSLVWQPPGWKLNSDNHIVRFLFEDSRGAIWFGTDVLLARLQGTRIDIIEGVSGSGASRLKRVFEDRDGQVWLVKADGLYRIVDGRAVPQPGLDEIASAQLACGFVDRERNLWLGTVHGGLARVQPRLVTVYTRRDGLAHDEVWSVCPSRDGGVWVGTTGGPSRLFDGRIEAVPARDPDALEPGLRSVMEDDAGNLWLGNAYSGHAKFLTTAGFTLVPRPSADPQVQVIYEDRDDNVWVGTKRGIGCSTSDQFLHWGIPYGFPIQTANPGNCFWNPEEVAVERLSMGLRHRRRNGRWEEWQRTGAPLPLAEWIPAQAADAERLARLVPPNEPSNHDVRAILQDRSGAMWFGTAGGLNRLWDRTFFPVRKEDGLVSDDVRALYEDTDGFLWVGTRNGLSRLPPPPSSWDLADEHGPGQPVGRIVSFTRAQGLFDNAINAILEDGQGFLWLTCPRGIFRVSRRELNEVAAGERAVARSMSFGEADGMLSAETAGGCQPTACETADGQLWFATMRGLVMIDPAQVRSNDQIPAVHVEALRVGDQVWRTTPAVHGTGATPRRLDLPPGAGHAFSVDYTAMSLRAPHKVRFKYRLEGHDRDWIDAGTRRTAYYTNLRPADYRFRVIACNDDNLWNDVGGQLAFRIAPFYYQTSMFRVVVLMAIGGIAGGLVRWRIRELRRSHAWAQETALARERRRIARDLHDHIGSQLTRLVVESGAPGPTRGRASRDAITEGRNPQAAGLAAKALQGLDQVVWLTDPGKDTVAHTVEYLSRHTRDFLADTGWRLRLDIPIDLPSCPLSAAARLALVRSTEEALANVLHHSGGTDVRLSAVVADGHVRITIEDNGHGFDAADSGLEGIGNGLANMRERLAEIGGQCEIQSSPGRGTRVTFTVPTDLNPTLGAAGLRPGGSQSS